jgi:hypothetical protein
MEHFITAINNLSTNSTFIVLSGACSIVAIALAFVFYFRSKERYTLSYSISGRVLLQPSKKPYDIDLPLSFAGRPISRLSRTFLLVQNHGNKLIETKDLASPSMIECKGEGELLAVKIVKVDDPASDLRLAFGADGRAKLDFAFLRPGDGFLIRVDHTARPDDLFLACKTKQAGPIRRFAASGRGIFLVLLMFVLLSFLVGWGVKQFEEVSTLLNEATDQSNLIVSFGSSLYIGFMLLLMVLVVMLATGSVLYVARWRLLGSGGLKASEVSLLIQMGRNPVD